MWTCNICGYPNNREEHGHCGRCGRSAIEGIHPNIEKCRESCRQGGYVKDPRDIYGINWIRCPMLGRPSCRYF